MLQWASDCRSKCSKFAVSDQSIAPVFFLIRRPRFFLLLVVFKYFNFYAYYRSLHIVQSHWITKQISIWHKHHQLWWQDKGCGTLTLSNKIFLCLLPVFSPPSFPVLLVLIAFWPSSAKFVDTLQTKHLDIICGIRSGLRAYTICMYNIADKWKQMNWKVTFSHSKLLNIQKYRRRSACIHVR